ncbi:MAG TPA: S4 domain-containing protein YaaA [Pseudogracilibacillus sp.]|nr:S4 domain-containing protein YaaA [Pseudogracilibacillus sp.]
MEKISIKSEYITLGQVLKLTNIFDSGGMIKVYLQDEGVFVNDELEHRRGRKLYENDYLQLKTGESFMIVTK